MTKALQLLQSLFFVELILPVSPEISWKMR